MATTEPLTLTLPNGEEDFAFHTSARGPGGIFRFQWTLAAGSKGPPPHLHPHETETFTIRSGRLKIWLGKELHDCGPGSVVVAKPGVTHRFHNPGPDPVVVDVTMDGPLQEDVLVGMAHHARVSGHQPTGGELFKQFLAQLSSEAIGVPGIPGRIMKGLARMVVALGLRPAEPPPRWDA